MAALISSLAKVLGESGRFVSDQVVVKLRTMMKAVMVTIAIVSALSGLSIGLAIRGASLPLWSGIALNAVKQAFLDLALMDKDFSVQSFQIHSKAELQTA